MYDRKLAKNRPSEKKIIIWAAHSKLVEISDEDVTWVEQEKIYGKSSLKSTTNSTTKWHDVLTVKYVFMLINVLMWITLYCIFEYKRTHS